MNRLPTLIIIASAIHFACICGEATVSKINGEKLKGKIVSINKSSIQFDNNQHIELNETTSIIWSKSSSALSHTPKSISFYDGSKLFATIIEIENNTCKISGTAIGKANLQLSTIRIIRLQQITKAHEESLESTVSSNSNFDRMLILKDNKIVTISCVVNSLDNRKLSINYDGKKRTLDNTKVYAIIFGGKKVKSETATAACFITFSDLSKIKCSLPTITNGRLSATTISGIKFELSLEKVVGIDIANDRLEFLSNLNPEEYFQNQLITMPFKYKNDTNVNGNPISLGGKKYKKGLGVHSSCTLSYNLSGRYELFTSVIGIDDEIKKSGDCIFKVTIDGKEAFSHRVKGGDKPKQVKLYIKNAQKLTLTVDFGEKLDIGDHADWADAKVIKAK